MNDEARVWSESDTDGLMIVEELRCCCGAFIAITDASRLRTVCRRCRRRVVMIVREGVRRLYVVDKATWAALGW